LLPSFLRFGSFILRIDPTSVRELLLSVTFPQPMAEDIEVENAHQGARKQEKLS